MPDPNAPRFRCAAFSQFAAAGIAVHSYDAHGHGRSESQRAKDRAYVHSYTHFVRLRLTPFSFRALSMTQVLRCLQELAS